MIYSMAQNISLSVCWISLFQLLVSSFYHRYLLGIFIYIRFVDGGPSVIKQNRVGLHGKQFKMYKFRTMKNNAHELRDDLQNLNKNDDVIFKIENDPRLMKGNS